MRNQFLNSLVELAAKDENIWLVCGDLGYSVLEPFVEKFPDRYVNAGICEQSMMGMAAGLAMMGKKVFIYSIANFPTLRCLEQIRNDVCYHNLPVKIVSVGGGFAYGSQGYTHHGLEDIGAMALLPRMKVLSPADPIEAKFATEFMAADSGPCYMRLNRSNEKKLHKREIDFVVGKSIVVEKGKNILIMASGNILEEALKAKEMLQEHNLDPEIWSFPFIKPFDEGAIKGAMEDFHLILTIEESQSFAGLGSLVASKLCEYNNKNSRLIRLAVPDAILHEAYNQESARKYFGLTAIDIKNQILNNL